MKSPITLSRHFAVMTALISGLLYGCASNKPLIGADQLTIDKISSDEMEIRAVYVRKSDDGIDITGKVKFQRAMIGTPPGHIDVTISDPSGKVLYKTHTHYYRNGRPTRKYDTFNFSSTIPLTPPKGSTLRLVHDAASQSSIGRDRHE